MELDSHQGGALELDQELVLQPGSPLTPQLPANDVASMPGFRFQPTEEELVGFYLRSMVMGNRLEVDLINVLNLYRYDPWELPAMAFMQGEREWLFFCPRDKKYPNGARPNRVTNSGYWKATGTDRPVRRADDARCIGLKKTLVFYTGKAPRGRKTEWIMNEYRLPQHEHTLCLKSLHHFHLNTPTTDVDRKEVALCRIYKKPFLISATANLFADSSIPVVVDAPSPKRVKVAQGHNNVKLESNSSSNAIGYEHGPRIPAAQYQVWSPVPDQRFMQAHRGERSMDRLNWADCFAGEERVASHNQLGDLGPTVASIDRLLKASMWSPLPPLNLDCGGALMKRDCGDDIVFASVGSVSVPPSLASMSSQFV